MLGSILREYGRRPRVVNGKRHNAIRGRSGRNRLSASHWKRQFHSVRSIHNNDRRTRANEFTISNSWYAYRVVITTASLSAFALGLIQFAEKLMGG